MASMLTRSGSELPEVERGSCSLLVINSNSSARVTAQLADTAAPYLGPGTTATFTNPDNGPEGIDCMVDDALAAVETARVVLRHRGDFDAFVVACGSDPGLQAARQVTDRPVVGLAEAGMLTACQLGQTFAIPMLSAGGIGRMRMLVRSYGLHARLASVFAVDTSSKAAAENPALMLQQLKSASRTAHQRDKYDVLVLTGSVLGQLAGRLSEELRVPVVSGLRAAIQSAEALAAAGLRTNRLSIYATPVKDDAFPGYPEFREFYQHEAAGAER
jgi:allantoin racemase